MKIHPESQMTREEITEVNGYEELQTIKKGKFNMTEVFSHTVSYFFLELIPSSILSSMRLLKEL